jgi:uncharacterized alkaline shock family protein YloU
VSGPGALRVGNGVITEMVRLAALEVPGVSRAGRAGAPWWRLLRGPSVSARISPSGVHVRVCIVARPGHPLRPLASQVQAAVAATIERMLGMELGGVTVVVDGVGG